MNGWVRVSRNNPCPVCNGPDNCCVSDDGGAVWCGRTQSDHQNNGGQFLHIMKDRDESAPVPARAEAVPTYMDGYYEKWYGENVVEHWLSLGSSIDLNDYMILSALSIGYGEDFWVIPEKDETGGIVGACRRYPDGKKFMITGGRRGLTYPDRWYDNPGPIYCPEGFTDVAHILQIGGCVVGRPSCSGGVEILAKLLRKKPSGKICVILGENDRKPEKCTDGCTGTETIGCCIQCWPGKWGPWNTARQLAEKLKEPIAWAMPPAQYKDIRDWLTNVPGMKPETLIDPSELQWEMPKNA